MLSEDYESGAESDDSDSEEVPGLLSDDSASDEDSHLPMSLRRALAQTAE